MGYIKEINEKISLPDEIVLLNAKKNDIGEINDVYCCKIKDIDEIKNAYIKIQKGKRSCLKYEYETLRKLREENVPVPQIIHFSEHNLKTYLIISEIKGNIIWDFIDPRRSLFDKNKIIDYVEKYGEILGQIHSVKIQSRPQIRRKLYSTFVDEKNCNTKILEALSWLEKNQIDQKDNVFVHGDYNLANVLISEEKISGVIDWEFSGIGWKEFDIAWALRPRPSFFNTNEERQAFLNGYKKNSNYNELHLNWCEIMNHVNFAKWYQHDDEKYSEEAIEYAMKLLNK